ncbi:hypothetical protein JRO89_XS13G0071700 [Xanthoceras sorbifolium]|uniref:Uncharacterized protein n=1 Tax=Xanthoceras sorbifolium TaxID=99658 RepID=A0ABQ8H724_9ROSI|nr:hypothetical protein JRO89_XS13G0071700 [Xanthoceras sorbifolium]
MAVQAQYPSNVLLLNRTGQEGHDYMLQPQPGVAGGGFLDQSYMLFNNGGQSVFHNIYIYICIFRSNHHF